MINAIAGIMAGLATILPMLKKKPYCVWVRSGAGGEWRNTNPAGNSARRCRMAASKFFEIGFKADDILILAKGITPPKE